MHFLFAISTILAITSKHTSIKPLSKVQIAYNNNTRDLECLFFKNIHKSLSIYSDILKHDEESLEHQETMYSDIVKLFHDAKQFVTSSSTKYAEYVDDGNVTEAYRILNMNCNETRNISWFDFIDFEGNEIYESDSNILAEKFPHLYRKGCLLIVNENKDEVVGFELPSRKGRRILVKKNVLVPQQFICKESFIRTTYELDYSLFAYFLSFYNVEALNSKVTKHDLIDRFNEAALKTELNSVLYSKLAIVYLFNGILTNADQESTILAVDCILKEAVSRGVGKYYPCLVAFFEIVKIE